MVGEIESYVSNLILIVVMMVMVMTVMVMAVMVILSFGVKRWLSSKVETDFNIGYQISTKLTTTAAVAAVAPHPTRPVRRTSNITNTALRASRKARSPRRAAGGKKARKLAPRRRTWQ